MVSLNLVRGCCNFFLFVWVRGMNHGSFLDLSPSYPQDENIWSLSTPLPYAADQRIVSAFILQQSAIWKPADTRLFRNSTMWGWKSGKGDEESGEKPLLSNVMQESSEIRWAFIRKVYSIVLLQLVMTAAFSAAVVFNPPVLAFFIGTVAGIAVYSSLIVIVFLGKKIILWTCVSTSFVSRFPL